MSVLAGKTLAALGIVFLLCGAASAQQEFTFRSPDRRVEVKILAKDRLRYDVSFKGKPLLTNSQISIDIDHVVLGINPKVIASKESTVDDVIEPVIRQKFAKIRDRHNELRLELAGGLAVVFRAYNEGAAYRLETSLPGVALHVYNEEALFQFAGDHTVYYPSEDSFFSHNERKYLPQTMSSITPTSLGSLPAVVDVGDGVKVAIAESDLEEYPGLWLKGTSGGALAATFPPYPLKEKLEKDRDFKVVESADYIAVTRGTRTFPWRVIGIAEKDGDLLTNQLVWLLEKTIPGAGYFVD